LCVIKKPRTRGGYSPTKGLQNTNPQWAVAPVKKKKLYIYIYMCVCVYFVTADFFGTLKVTWSCFPKV